MVGEQCRHKDQGKMFRSAQHDKVKGVPQTQRSRRSADTKVVEQRRHKGRGAVHHDHNLVNIGNFKNYPKVWRGLLAKDLAHAAILGADIGGDCDGELMSFLDGSAFQDKSHEGSYE